MTSFTPFGCLTLPAWAGDEEAAAIIAGRTATDIGEIECVCVDELDAEIPLLFDGRNGEHHGFGAQIHAEHRIGRIGIGCLDGRIGWRIDARNVDEMVPGSLVFRIFGIDEIGVLDAVVIHHREAVDIGFLGDGARLLRG